MDTLDPEVTVLLKEIVRAGSSKLFTVTPESLRSTLFDSRPRVSAHAPELSSAERHLLATRREELGDMLYEHGVDLLLTDPEFGYAFHQERNTQGPVQAPTPARRAARSRALLEAADSFEAEDAEAVSLLGRCLQSSPGRSVTPAQVMSVVLRVTPGDRARVCQALALHAAGEQRESERVLERVLGANPTARIRSYALDELGRQAAQDRRFPAALEAYRISAHARKDRIPPLVGWLCAALQLGASVEAREAAARLDELTEPENALLQGIVASLRRGRAQQRWAPRAAAAQSRRDVEPFLGRASTEVLHAFD